MKVFIQALEESLTEDELRQHLSPEKLKSLREKGGILQAYTLAHEGVSRPRVVGEGQQSLKWPRAVIQRLMEKIKQGTKFFLGHGSTNDHDGRETVGEVLASFVKEIGGRLSNIIVGHFPDGAKVQAMDVCSMEADVHVDGDVVGDVNDVTGVALGNSNKESPAFPGALRLRMLQCFDKKVEATEPGEGAKQVTFEEVRKAIKDLNIHPWQVFSVEDMKNDRSFGKLFEDNARLSAENERLTKENSEISERSKEALRKSEVAEATKKLDTMLSEGFTDKQRTFIRKQFDPERVSDLTDEGLKSFVENGKKEYAETARLFGVAEDSSKQNGGSDKSSSSAVGDSETADMEEEALKLIGVDNG